MVGVQPYWSIIVGGVITPRYKMGETTHASIQKLEDILGGQNMTLSEGNG